MEKELWLKFALLLFLFELQIKARKEACLDYVQHVSIFLEPAGTLPAHPHTQMNALKSQTPLSLQEMSLMHLQGKRENPSCR